MIDTFHQIALKAAAEILEVYNSSVAVAATDKSDGSPLTEADNRANHLIVAELTLKFPGMPILSEEGGAIPWKERQHWQKFFLIDPLDGTREFISRNGDFTVNIALIEEGVAVAGLVHIPISQISYGAERGRGAMRIAGNQKNQIKVSTPALDRPLRVVGSRSHASPEQAAFLELLPGAELMSRGSALKLCMIAEGAAEVYPRHGPTSLWDVAAGHCVISEAGGFVCDRNGDELRYGLKESVLNPPFIAGSFNQQQMTEFFSRSLTS